MADVVASTAARAPRLRRVGVVRGGTRLAVGGVLVAVLLLTALLSPIIAPHDPLEQDLLSSQLPPAWMAGADKNFLLGTDSLGRCVLSRIIYAARTAVLVAFIAATVAGAIGTALGL